MRDSVDNGICTDEVQPLLFTVAHSPGITIHYMSTVITCHYGRCAGVEATLTRLAVLGSRERSSCDKQETQER